MPIGRYLIFTSSMLLALLFLADWCMPSLVAEPAQTEIDRSIMRIHSGHRWPEAVAIDTSIKTIAPSPADNVDKVSSPADGSHRAASSPNDSFAYAGDLPPSAHTTSMPRPNPVAALSSKRRRRVGGRQMATDQPQRSHSFINEW